MRDGNAEDNLECAVCESLFYSAADSSDACYEEIAEEGVVWESPSGVQCAEGYYKGLPAYDSMDQCASGCAGMWDPATNGG